MTLDRLRPVTDRILEPVVVTADRLGASPNRISVVALLVAGLASGAFYLGGTNRWLYVAGGLLVGVTGTLDLIDGQLARYQNRDSAAGDLLDHVLDRYADVLLIAGLAAGIQRYALGFVAVTGVLLTSYLGTQSQAVGLDRTYGGLLGRADRLVLIGVGGVVAAVYPGPVGPLPVIGWVLAVFGVVGHLTAIQRFVLAWRDLR